MTTITIKKITYAIKVHITRYVFQHFYKGPEKVLLGRWNLKYKVMDKYEGKNYPY